MIPAANSELREHIAAALDWWLEAGVDSDWLDQPQVWLSPPALADAAETAISLAKPISAPELPPPPPAPPVLDRSDWPQSVESIADWWRSSDWLDSAPAEARVMPRGNHASEVMVLVAEPEAEDRDLLLSGAQGRLLDAMLAAMGLAEEQVYRASVVPRPTPHADWSALQARGLGELARHHISLAAPKRLIVFGGHILPLLGNDPANNLPFSAEINHGSGKIPMLAARDLAVLLERPRWKAAFWQAWLEWTRD